MMRALGFLFAIVLSVAACDRQAEAKELYSLQAKAQPSELAVGGKGEVSLAIEPKPGAHFSDEAPIKITLKGSNVAVGKEVLSKQDANFEKGGARFSVPFTAQSVGKGSVEMCQTDLSFYLCTDKLCERQTKSVSIPVLVK